MKKAKRTKKTKTQKKRTGTRTFGSESKSAAISLCRGRLSCSVSSSARAPVGTNRAFQSRAPRIHRSAIALTVKPNEKKLSSSSPMAWRAREMSGSRSGSSRCSNPSTALSSPRRRANTLVCASRVSIPSSPPPSSRSSRFSHAQGHPVVGKVVEHLERDDEARVVVDGSPPPGVQRVPPLHRVRRPTPVSPSVSPRSLTPSVTSGDDDVHVVSQLASHRLALHLRERRGYLHPDVLGRREDRRVGRQCASMPAATSRYRPSSYILSGVFPTLRCRRVVRRRRRRRAAHPTLLCAL